MYNQMADSCDTLTVVCVGDVGVGTSSLINRFVYGEAEPFMANRFFGVHVKSIQIGDTDTIVQLAVRDTDGRGRFLRSLEEASSRKALAYVVAYDITSQISFEGAKRWCEDVCINSPNDMVAALVGCKADLAARRQVDIDSAKAWALEKGFLVLETSARNNENVDHFFQMLAFNVIHPPECVLNIEICGDPTCSNTTVPDLDWGTSHALRPDKAAQSLSEHSERSIVVVTTLAGREVARVCNVDLFTDDIGGLRREIAEQSKIPPKRQALVFDARSLREFPGHVKLASACFGDLDEAKRASHRSIGAQASSGRARCLSMFGRCVVS